MHVEPVKPTGGLPASTPEDRPGKPSKKEQAVAKILRDGSKEVERADAAMKAVAPVVRKGASAKPTLRTKNRRGQRLSILPGGVTAY